MENCFWCSIRNENEGNVKRAIQQSKKQIKIKPMNPEMNQKIFCYNHIHKGNTSPVPITLEKTKDRFKEDNPDWKSKLLSVPIANIKTVKFPRHKILEDAKEHLKDKYKKLSEEKKSFLNGLKLDVENIVLKSENKELPGQISENIAEKILKPNVKDKTKALETLKQELKRVINSAIVNHTNQTDLIDNIYGIIEKRVLKGIEEEIVGSSDYGSMILRKGEEAELLVKEKIEEAVGDNSALVVNGFKVWEYTNQALANIGVKLKTATKKSEVEHDIMLMTTHQLQPQVHLTFVQVKDPDIRPWHEEEGCEDSEERKKNFEKLASKALEQTVKDITAFFEMFPDLTEEEADNISFDCFAALPNSTGEGLCPNCKVKILTKEVFDDVDKLRSTLKIGTSEMADGAQDLYSKIASRYIGAGSLVPLKTLGDYYKEVAKQMNDVDTQMERSFREAPEDQTNVELALKLSDVQHSVVKHRGSKILCGPHGSGKTILLLLGVAKKIQEFKDRGMKTKACLIVWERSQELKKKFNDFAKQYEGDEDTIVKVVFKDEIFKENGIDDDGDRVEAVNKLMVKLEQLGWQIIAIDEIKIINDYSKNSLKNLLIKIKSLFTEVVVSDWSKLSPPASTTLFLSFQPVMSPHAAFFNLSLPPVTEVTGPPTMPVFTLQQVFRSTTKIHQLLQSLHRDREASVQEAWSLAVRGAGRFQDSPSCVMDPGKEERGHGITGLQPTWTILPRCSHFACDDTVGCFLEKNKPKIRQHLQDLLDIYDREDVTIVVDVERNEAAKKWFKEELNTERVFSVQEFVGGETQALLFLKKGEYWNNPLKYNGWSRATSHLTVVTDDTFTLTYWELQAAKDNFQGDPQTPDPPSTASYRRTLARIFARHNWVAFIGGTLFIVLILLFMFPSLVVASLLHGNFPLLIKRLVDRRGGDLRYLAVLGWTCGLFLIIDASPYPVTGGLVYWLVINVAATVAATTQLSSKLWRLVEMVPGGILFTVAIIILFLIEGMEWIYTKIGSMNAVIVWIVWYYNYEMYEVDLF